MNTPITWWKKEEEEMTNFITNTGEIDRDSGGQSQEELRGSRHNDATKNGGIFSGNTIVFAFIIAVSLKEDSRVSEQDIIAHLDRDFGKDEIRDTIVEGQETYLRIVTEDNLLILLYYFIVSS
ncbi:hypothetical protein RCL_jg6202.t1 [Rhizophagus clarus]|uniref:Uncharacterized protein n=1 Tax=Rhizophagus clarus TaxID=94130 RepID=A0A8H3L5C9_9GLOM|nr:hypothetical protein RCL_jg6202.t1 [Rhizophagus clarus]